MKVILAAIVLFLVGCAGPGTSYFMVSKGEASGVARLFGGGVDYCKITQQNFDEVSFTGDIVYGEDGCRVEVTASDNKSEF